MSISISKTSPFILLAASSTGSPARFNPGGIAGIYARENSRDALFTAMQRRETFGTSGPRIEPRFYAGWSLPEDLCDAPDVLAVAGQYQVRERPPFIPGNEASGVVTAVGDKVTRFRTGDRIIAALRGGAFAEKSVIDQRYAIRLPESMGFEEGAAPPEPN